MRLLPIAALCLGVSHQSAAQYSEAAARERTVRISYSYYDGTRWVAGADHVSGMLVSDRGHILTVAHLIRESTPRSYLEMNKWRRLKFAAKVAGRERPLSLIQPYPGSEDALLLEVSDRDTDERFAFFDLAGSESVPATRTVTVWGFPEIRLKAKSASLSGDCTTKAACEIDKRFENGFSGSAVLVDDVVIGMMTTTSTTVGEDSALTHIGRLRSWLEDHVELTEARVGKRSGGEVVEVDYPVDFELDKPSVMLNSQQEFREVFQADSGHKITRAIFDGTREHVKEQNVHIADDGGSITVTVVLESGTISIPFVGRYKGVIKTRQVPVE